jgi:hypothetical protein
MEFFPKFVSPPNTLNHKQTMEFIMETFPTETPLAGPYTRPLLSST